MLKLFVALAFWLPSYSASAQGLPKVNPGPTEGNPCNSRSGGMFPDVAFYGGKLWCAIEAASKLQVLELNDDLTVGRSFSRPLPLGIAFPRLGVSNGALWVAYRDGSTGMLWNVLSSQPEPLGPACGNDPFAVGEGFVFFQGPTCAINRRPLTGGAVVDLGPGRPTGLSRVLPGGTVTLVDDDRVLAGLGTRPCWAGNMVVVEGPDGGNVVEQGGQRGIVWPGAIAFTPRCAATDGKYAIVNWGQSHARLYTWRTKLPEAEKPKTYPLIWTHPPGASARLSGIARLEGILLAPHNTAGVDILVNLRKIGEAKISGPVWTYNFDTTPFSGGINLSALLREKDGATSRYTLRAELDNEGGAPVALHSPAASASAAPAAAAPSTDEDPGHDEYGERDVE